MKGGEKFYFSRTAKEREIHFPEECETILRPASDLFGELEKREISHIGRIRNNSYMPSVVRRRENAKSVLG